MRAGGKLLRRVGTDEGKLTGARLQAGAEKQRGRRPAEAPRSLWSAASQLPESGASDEADWKSLVLKTQI